MRCIGKITASGINPITRTVKLEIEAKMDVAEHVNELMGCKLSIELKKYREARSLNANAYAWVLMSKIASVIGTSKEEVYEEMLRHYGTLYEDDGGYITITVKNSVDISVLDGHWLPIRSNGDYTGYAMIKGSSEYDTKEMSVFIDGIVSECQDLNIQTATPDEIARMKQEWGVDIG